MSEESLPLDTWQALVDAATPGPWVNDATYYLAGINDGSHLGWEPPASMKQGECSFCSGGWMPNILVGIRQINGKNYHIHRVPNDPDWDFDRENNWRRIYSHTDGTGITGNFDVETGGVASTEADAAFICAAREAMPKLIARVRELEAFIDSQESRWR